MFPFHDSNFRSGGAAHRKYSTKHRGLPDFCCLFYFTLPNGFLSTAPKKLSDPVRRRNQEQESHDKWSKDLKGKTGRFRMNFRFLQYLFPRFFISSAFCALCTLVGWKIHGKSGFPFTEWAKNDRIYLTSSLLFLKGKRTAGVCRAFLTGGPASLLDGTLIYP